MLDGWLISVGSTFGVPALDSMPGVSKKSVLGFYSVPVQCWMVCLILFWWVTDT